MLRMVFLAFVTVVGIRATAVADPPAPSDKPLGVEVADGLALRHAARGRNLAYKVSYPEGDGPYPLIVFSTASGEARTPSPALPDTGPAMDTW